MHNDPTTSPDSTHNHHATREPVSPPPSHPLPPPPPPNPVRRGIVNGGAINAPPERGADSQKPALPVPAMREVKRCLFVKPDGRRCGRLGRWKSGLCGFHDPSRAGEIHEMRRRAGEAMVRNKTTRSRGMSNGNVCRFMDLLRQVNGKKESTASALDWIAEKLLRGEICPKTAMQLRVLTARRNSVLASYSKPCRQRRGKPPAVPAGGLPLPCPSMDQPQAPDAPQGILGANTGTPVPSPVEPDFGLPPPFELPEPPPFEIPPSCSPAEGQS